ncbi:hypothetical protein WMY93_031509 [Mugilogobius chulae]|uniref:Uncharacterized protein n=1 Tax=Mugilogobius chulae TaxID=88201 RepID=A0AAW0MDA8_9GOBI
MLPGDSPQSQLKVCESHGGVPVEQLRAASVALSPALPHKVEALLKPSQHGRETHLSIQLKPLYLSRVVFALIDKEVIVSSSKIRNMASVGAECDAAFALCSGQTF